MFLYFADENVLQIYPLANEYQIEWLKEKCIKFMIHRTSLEVKEDRYLFLGYSSDEDTFRPTWEHRYKNAKNVSKVKKISNAQLVKYINLAELFELKDLRTLAIDSAAHIMQSHVEQSKAFETLSVETILDIANCRIKILEKHGSLPSFCQMRDC